MFLGTRNVTALVVTSRGTDDWNRDCSYEHRFMVTMVDVAFRALDLDTLVHTSASFLAEISVSSP